MCVCVCVCVCVSSLSRACVCFGCTRTQLSWWSGEAAPVYLHCLPHASPPPPLPLSSHPGSTSPNSTACQAGTYSLAGASVCLACPQGRYGATAGLSSNACTGPCGTSVSHCPTHRSYHTNNPYRVLACSCHRDARPHKGTMLKAPCLNDASKNASVCCFCLIRLLFSAQTPGTTVLPTRRLAIPSHAQWARTVAGALVSVSAARRVGLGPPLVSPPVIAALRVRRCGPCWGVLQACMD